MAAAEATREWERVERVASRDLELGLRESGGGFYDTWPTRGYAAGARLARGDPGGRDALFARAPRHPEAWGILARTARWADHPSAGVEVERLEGFAPGMARQVERALERRRASR